MKKWFAIGILCFANYMLTAQIIPSQLIDSISFQKSHTHFVGVDQLENLYFTNYEVITKINNNKEWVYTNYELGIPTYISTINPLQIMVFYKENNTVVFLDRFLNETQRIDLNTINPTLTAWWVGNTKNKEIWIFDGAKNNLNYFSYLQNVSFAETIPLLNEPKDYTANLNNAYVLTKEKLRQYNIQGSLVNEINIPNSDAIQSNISHVICKTDEALQIYDINLTLIGYIVIPKNNTSGFSLTNEKLYIYKENTLYKYKVAFPSKK